jgi:nitrate reductase NapE component
MDLSYLIFFAAGVGFGFVVCIAWLLYGPDGDD